MSQAIITALLTLLGLTSLNGVVCDHPHLQKDGTVITKHTLDGDCNGACYDYIKEHHQPAPKDGGAGDDLSGA